MPGLKTIYLFHGDELIALNLNSNLRFEAITAPLSKLYGNSVSKRMIEIRSMKKDGPRVYMKDLPEDQSFYFVEFSTSLDPYSWQDDQAESNYHYKRPYCISDYLNAQVKYLSSYKRNLDLFNGFNFEEVLLSQYMNIQFGTMEKRTIVGRGRNGDVILGACWDVDCPDHKTLVAVKIFDISQNEKLTQQVKTETRVITYANENKLSCVPKLAWSGFCSESYYINCTDLIDGYKKDLNKLNQKERELFEHALVELRMVGITHGNICKQNVIFTETKCYLVGFSNAKISEEMSIEGLEFDFNKRSLD